MGKRVTLRRPAPLTLTAKHYAAILKSLEREEVVTAKLAELVRRKVQQEQVADKKTRKKGVLDPRFRQIETHLQDLAMELPIARRQFQSLQQHALAIESLGSPPAPPPKKRKPRHKPKKRLPKPIRRKTRRRR